MSLPLQTSGPACLLTPPGCPSASAHAPCRANTHPVNSQLHSLEKRQGDTFVGARGETGAVRQGSRVCTAASGWRCALCREDRETGGDAVALAACVRITAHGKGDAGQLERGTAQHAAGSQSECSRGGVFTLFTKNVTQEKTMHGFQKLQAPKYTYPLIALPGTRLKDPHIHGERRDLKTCPRGTRAQPQAARP